MTTTTTELGTSVVMATDDVGPSVNHTKLWKMDKPALIFGISLLITLIYTHSAQALGNIIFAVNAGGDSHVDIYGIQYQKGFISFLV